MGKNSAITSYFNGTGALYRYYNGNTGINATVSAKDEFYYNPKTSSKHYDLDDVTYVTSKVCQGRRYRLYPLHRLRHQVRPEG